MTRATYNTDNTLTEISEYGPPPDKPNPKFYSTGQREMYQRHTEAWRIVMQDYNANKEQYEKTLRTLVCSPECRGLWKPGDKLEEGKDYELRLHYHAPDDKELTAFPLPVKSEDRLWKDLLNRIIALREERKTPTQMLAELKSQYIITKR